MPDDQLFPAPARRETRRARLSRRLRPTPEIPPITEIDESVWRRASQDTRKALTSTLFGLVFLGILGKAFGGMWGVVVAIGLIFAIRLLAALRVQRNGAREAWRSAVERIDALEEAAEAAATERRTLVEERNRFEAQTIAVQVSAVSRAEFEELSRKVETIEERGDGETVREEKPAS
jgi:hypothetical protein